MRATEPAASVNLESHEHREHDVPVAETIVDLTRGITLEPGDLVVTGTPSGVGHARKPPLWMRHGDVCEIEIEGVGVLCNPIADEIEVRAAAE